MMANMREKQKVKNHKAKFLFQTEKLHHLSTFITAVFEQMNAIFPPATLSSPSRAAKTEKNRFFCGKSIKRLFYDLCCFAFPVILRENEENSNEKKLPKRQLDASSQFQLIKREPITTKIAIVSDAIPNGRTTEGVHRTKHGRWTKCTEFTIKQWPSTATSFTIWLQLPRMKVSEKKMNSRRRSNE